MYFTNSSEATVALLSLVLSADRVATIREREYLFNRIRNLEPYKDLNRKALNREIAGINEQLFGTRDAYDSLMRPEGIAQFSNALKAVVPTRLLESLFQMACEIACIDGLNTIERRILSMLRRNLGMTSGNAES